MSSAYRKSLYWGAGIALFLGYGLSPTGWLFYELSHLLNAPTIYPLYSVFRGADYFFSMQEYKHYYCLLAGGLVGSLVYWRSATKG